MTYRRSLHRSAPGATRGEERCVHRPGAIRDAPECAKNIHDANAKVTTDVYALVAQRPDQLQRASDQRFPYALVTCEPVEKLHHLQVRQFLGGTAHDGGCGRASATEGLLRIEARRVYRMAKPPGQTKQRIARVKPVQHKRRARRGHVVTCCSL
jgi:hypothetical protein